MSSKTKSHDPPAISAHGMSESLWYASRPYPPHCRRLTRQSAREQYGSACEFAVDWVAGRASQKHGRVSQTGETSWYWPSRPGSPSGWWLLPERTLQIARRTIAYAEARAQEDARRGTVQRDEHGWPDTAKRRDVHLQRLLRAAQRAKRRPIGDVVYLPWRQVRDKRRLSRLDREVQALRSIHGTVAVRVQRLQELQTRRRMLAAECALRRISATGRGHSFPATCEEHERALMRAYRRISNRHRPQKEQRRWITLSTSGT